MLGEMTNNKAKMVEFLGTEEKYIKEVEALEKLKEREEKKGVFITEAGVVDRRGDKC